MARWLNCSTVEHLYFLICANLWKFCQLLQLLLSLWNWWTPFFLFFVNILCCSYLPSGNSQHGKQYSVWLVVLQIRHYFDIVSLLEVTRISQEIHKNYPHWHLLALTLLTSTVLQKPVDQTEHFLTNVFRPQAWIFDNKRMRLHRTALSGFLKTVWMWWWC